MENDYKNQISKFFPVGEEGVDKLFNELLIREIPLGTILLSEGQVATQLFLVLKGCLRTCFVKENGKEITSQFFTESHMVSSFESAMTGTPSRVYIEAIEDSVIGIILVENLRKVIAECKSVRDHFNGFLMTRLIHYMNQHASFILDNPEKRYLNLVRDNPELVSRLPQQYIASYLGITPVSLSRIRGRIKKQINNG